MPQRRARSSKPSRSVAGLASLLALAALAPAALRAIDGDLDFSFGYFGRAVRGQGVGRAVVAREDGSLRLAIDGDGRIVVGGRTGLGADERPYVARRLANGDPGPTFAGLDGVRTFTDLEFQHTTGLAIDPVEEAIVVTTGKRQIQGSADCAVARLTLSGGFDLSFAGDGVLELSLLAGSNLRQVHLQSDGKIVAVGDIRATVGEGPGFLLVRLLPNGFFDFSWGGDGIVPVEFDLEPDAGDHALAATLSGGRLVTVGTAFDGGAAQIALMRTRSALVFAGDFERGSSAG